MVRLTHISLLLSLSTAMWLCAQESSDDAAAAARFGPMPVSNDKPQMIDLSQPGAPLPYQVARSQGMLPPQGQQDRPKLGEVNIVEFPESSEEDLGNGKSIGRQIGRSSLVDKKEKNPDQKALVYPDDPQSAWWETNPRYAFARAQREMRPMMLLFTAVWAPEAMQLSEQVFSSRSFNEYVKENLVICYMTYPRNITEAGEAKRWVKKEFKVAGYPSILIFNPHGEVQRSMRGYKKDRPVDYFNELKAACAPILADIEQQKASLINQGYRKWHNSEGRYIFARFIRRGDHLMTLRDCRGQEWTLQINQLAPPDQKMSRSFPRIDQVLRNQQLPPSEWQAAQ